MEPIVTNPIIVGDFTYIADPEFECHMTHLYEWNGNRLTVESPSAMRVINTAGMVIEP